MNVVFPDTLGEALDRLADDHEMVPIAGSTDLFVDWPEQTGSREKRYLDLWHVDGFSAVTVTDDAVVLGAGTTYWDVISRPDIVARFPLLADAARQIGAIQIQTRGTWAGNIANGSPAADGVPVLMAYDAEVVLRSTGGERGVPLSSFYTGYKEMNRRPDELIVAIRLPRHQPSFERFVKVGARRAQAIAKVGLAIACSGDGWRVVAASVAPTVRRLPSVERLLDEEAAIDAPEALIPALRADVAPIDDIRSTAAYRERVLSRILYHTVNEARA